MDQSTTVTRPWSDKLNLAKCNTGATLCLDAVYFFYNEKTECFKHRRKKKKSIRLLNIIYLKARESTFLPAYVPGGFWVANSINFGWAVTSVCDSGMKSFLQNVKRLTVNNMIYN